MAVAATTVLAPAISHGAHPGTNGKITFIRGNSVYTINPDGTGATPVAAGDNEFPDFSPDGNRIAFGRFITSTFELVTMNADGSGETQITPTGGASDQQPAYSPDGSMLAFSRLSDPGRDIYKMAADGSGVATPLTATLASDTMPEWSPDGTQIVHTSTSTDADVVVMDADGSDQEKLAFGVGNETRADWSPDGSKIVYQNDVDGDVEIYVRSSDGSGTATQLTFNTVDDASPAYSPDGSKIVFHRNGDLYTMNADGSAVSPLTSGAPNDIWPDWGDGGVAVVSAPSISLSGKSRQKAGKLKVKASCGGPACEVEFGGGKVTVVTRSVSVAKSTKFKLKGKELSLAANETKTVKLKFKKKHKKTVKTIDKLLKKGGKKAKKRSKVVVKATATSAGGSDSAKKKIKLKR